jgi:hypothetical protein
VLRQATAVLVPLATLLAAKLSPVALLAVLGQGLTVASTAISGVLRVGTVLLGRAVVGVVNGTAGQIALHVDHALVRQARRGGRKTVLPRDGTGALGQGVSSGRGIGRDRYGGRYIGVSKCGREGGNVGARVRDGLAASHTVIGVERARQEGVGVVAGMSLAGSRAIGRGARKRRPVSQWPRGGLHFPRRCHCG